MNYIKRFKNTIIALLALIMYVLCLVVLLGLLGIENWQILGISRTSIIMIFTFCIMGFLLVRAYGGYNVGIRKSKPMITSLSIAMILDDIVTYMVLIIMNTNDANGRRVEFGSIGFLLLAMLCQIIVIWIFARLGNGFYFLVNPAEKTLVITGDEKDWDKVRKAIEIFHSRYTITECCVSSDSDADKKIAEADSVFFYDVPKEVLERLSGICYKTYKSIYINPDIQDILIHSGQEIFFSDMPFYHTKARNITFEQRIIKRLGDIFISLAGLIVASPVFLIAALAIKHEDHGHVFFRQERATVGGRVFKIIKFRTMKENIENFSVTKDDDRITRAGRWLRKYRIDELPQLINILKGDMSLVGPRPEMMKNVEEYTASLPEFRYRLRMKAGLTGYAQVMGKYNTSSRDKLILDLMYIENFSIANDIKIILQTVTVLFSAEESTEAFDGK